MKKWFGLIGVFGCAVAAVSTPALAGDDWNFYVGGDYQYSGFKLKAPEAAHFSSQLNDGMNIHAGLRYGEFFAAELGYQQGSSDRIIYGPKVQVPGSNPPVFQRGPLLETNRLTVGGPSLDGFAYYPITHWVDVFATAGVTYLNGEAKIVPSAANVVASSKSEIGVRGGAGLEFYFNRHVGLRLSGRYQSANFGGIVNRGIVGSVGVNFYF